MVGVLGFTLAQGGGGGATEAIATASVASPLPFSNGLGGCMGLTARLPNDTGGGGGGEKGGGRGGRPRPSPQQ